MNQITWLHLSDIHFLPKAKWREGHAHAALLAYLKRRFRKEPHLRPDLIFCTGDIAFAPLHHAPLVGQYGQAKKFFDDLLIVCGKDRVPMAKERLFVVPGNYDIDRSLISQGAQVDMEARAAEIDRRFYGRQLEFQNDIRRLTDYGKFVKSYLPHQHDPDGRMFYTQTLDVGGVQVGIAGFNSAWSCSGDEDDSLLWMAAQWQFDTAQAALQDATLRIALMHHPIDNLNPTERDTVTLRLADDFHFFLHGHAHHAWVEPGACVSIAAGPVDAAHEGEFGMNLVQLDLEENTVEVHLQRFDKTDWITEPESVRAPKGMWRLALIKQLPPTRAAVQAAVTAPLPTILPEPAPTTVTAPAPPQPPTPLYRTKLYGREHLLRTTAAKLNQRSLVLVFGMRGNGKTRFIEALAQQVPLPGEAVRIQADPDMNADHLFRQFAYALGETAEFPLAPVGDIEAIANELKRRYPRPRSAWLWLDRAHVLLDAKGFRLPEVRKLLLGVHRAYGKAWPIVLELRERPPRALLSGNDVECEVPGLDKDALGQALADAAPAGLEADWHLYGAHLERVYHLLGGGEGKQAHPLALSFLIEIGRATRSTPIKILAPQGMTDNIEAALLGDLFNKVLNPTERQLIQALALYPVAIPQDHANWLEDELALPGAWDGIALRCLLTSNGKGAVFYLHDFIADWLRAGLGYQATDKAAPATDKTAPAELAYAVAPEKALLAQHLQMVVAGCWLKQLGGGMRQSRFNFDQALEAFFHLTAGTHGARGPEIAIALFGGNQRWAAQRLEALAIHLYQVKAPIIERRKVLEYWVKLKPDEPKAWRFLGESWAREEGWASDNALHCFEKACQLLPSFPPYWANLGKCLLARGTEGAKTFLLRLAVLAQDHPHAIDDHVIAVQLNCLMRLGAHTMASHLRMKEINNGSRCPAFYADEAKARLNAGDTQDALRILNLAEKRHCSDNVIAAIRSSALEANGQASAAQAVRMKKINAGSPDPIYYNDEAKARLTVGNAQGALDILDLAVQNRCADDHTDAIRADVLTRLGQPQAASALRMDKINGGSRHPAFYNAQAQALLAQGGEDGALAALEILNLAQQRGCTDAYTAAIRASALRALSGRH